MNSGAVSYYPTPQNRRRLPQGERAETVSGTGPQPTQRLLEPEAKLSLYPRPAASGKHKGISVPNTSGAGAATHSASSGNSFVDCDENGDRLPPMSKDGGNEEEFKLYWENFTPQRFPGDWIKYWSHPQVNVLPYWYNLSTRAIRWHAPTPECDGIGDSFVYECEPLRDDGPVWDMSVKELREMLSKPHEAFPSGVSYTDIARRAVFEYEEFWPRVLSWHDYQHITFWFFGGSKAKKDSEGRDERSNSHFFGDNSTTRELFADDIFFHEVAKVVLRRMHLMHPINLCYLVWSFVRANVIHPELMQATADFFCDGRFPMCDRCALGMIPWCFSKLNIRNSVLFELASQEAQRPIRTRSLAPRNYQNLFLSFSRLGIRDEGFIQKLSAQMPRLLDNHDPRYPKLKQSVLFSYTCKDGSEVPADCFRVSSLVVILSSLARLSASGFAVDNLLASMADYTRRSMERSPAWMFEPRDGCQFLCELSRSELRGLPGALHMEALVAIAHPTCQRAGTQELALVEQAYRRVGILWPTSAV